MGEPSFIIIGAMRSGTTALYSDICQHSKVRRALKKELNYYWYWYGDTERYCSRFPDGWISGEASPAYLLCGEFCAERIYKDFPNVKIILILRNPVDRLWSHWWHVQKHETWSFDKAIAYEPQRLAQMKKTDFDYLRYSYQRQGEYYTNLQPYLRLFESILVLQTERYFKERQSEINRVFSFIGLEPEQINEIPFRQQPYPDMDDTLKTILHYNYVDMNELLFEAIGERFDW